MRWRYGTYNEIFFIFIPGLSFLDVSLKNKQLFYGTLFRITNGCHGSGILNNQKG